MSRPLRPALALAALLAVLSGAPAFCQQSVRAAFGQKPREILVVAGPEQEKALFFYGQNCYSSLWLSATAQESLASCAQKYQEKFEAKRLKKPGSKSGGRFLASAQVRLEWGSKKDSADRSAPAKARFGYDFEGNSPYFVISVPSVRSPSSQSPALESSEEIRLLFTRAQLQNLVRALSGL